jgi:hypothetical protein
MQQRRPFTGLQILMNLWSVVNQDASVSHFVRSYDHTDWHGFEEIC